MRYVKLLESTKVFNIHQVCEVVTSTTPNKLYVRGRYLGKGNIVGGWVKTCNVKFVTKEGEPVEQAD